MTAFARLGSHRLSTRRAWPVRTVGPPRGPCSAPKAISRLSVSGLPGLRSLLTGTVFANTRQRPATLVR